MTNTQIVEKLRKRILELQTERTLDTTTRGHRNPVARTDRACMSAEITGIKYALLLLESEATA